MFFYIGTNPPITSLKEVDEDLYLDKGWDISYLNDVKVWYKGYSTECCIGDKLEEILTGYKPKGKWCVISGREIYHPVHRGFPLYVQGNNKTNLQIQGFEFVNIMLSPPLFGETLSIDVATEKIKGILLKNIQNFLDNNPQCNVINVLYSGGLDTLTVWALLEYLRVPYNLDVYVPKNQDGTLTSIVDSSSDYESDLIDATRKSFWGYRISRFYANLNWNITGFYAERHQLRTVDNMVEISNFMGKQIYDLVNPKDYLYAFLYRYDVKSTMTTYKTTNFLSEQELKTRLYRTIASDNQMWHLDNTFHFNPFFDSNITDIACLISLDDMILNFRNGYIQRKIIESTKPDLLPLLSEYKNCGDIFGNFVKNWHSVKLTSAAKVSIR